MNPLLILVVIYILSNKDGTLGNIKMPDLGRLGLPPIGKLGLPPIGPGYIDTFKMELLLDRLNSMTSTLEKVNHLNQMRNIPFTKSNSIDRIQESVDAVRGFINDNKTGKKLDTINQTLNGVKRIGDMEGLMSNIGPILSLLSSQNENKD